MNDAHTNFLNSSGLRSECEPERSCSVRQDSNLLRRVGGKLTELLTETTPDGGTATARRAEETMIVSREEFERHLRSLVRADAETMPLAGRVNFIGLSKIREKLGERWPAVSDRADEITRRAIERRLTSVDVYTRYKELHYLIVFAQLTKEQAQLKCALIAEDITKRLLGEDIAPELLDVKTMISPLGGDVAFEDVPTIEELAAKLAEGGEDPSPAPADDNWWESQDDPAADPLDGLRIVYRPMWDVRRNAVTTFVAVPARPSTSGDLMIGETQLPSLANVALLRRLDFIMQRRVITDLRSVVTAKHRQLMCLPVHFETLASVASRNQYLDLCVRGIPEAGKLLIVFELAGVPSGAPPSRLLDLATMLRRFSRGVLLRTNAVHPTFRPPTETGVAAIGYEALGSTIPEVRQMQEMERFAVAAKRAGLTTYIHGLRTLSLTTAAIAAGFDFVDGNVVTSVVERPLGAYRFEPANLFQGRGRSVA